VAWVTPEPDGELIAAALRAALRRTLPEFMVPASIVVLPALPLAPNGKVDRRALPDPEGAPARGAGGSGGSGERAEPPANALERRIAALWSALLGVERVDRGDNFFDLGGHSLLLVELRSRLREELGQEVSMLDLFRHTTVKGLAEHLDGGAADGAPGGVPGRGPERREEIAGGKQRLRQRLAQRRS
jgi:acyl carrier protein